MSVRVMDCLVGHSRGSGFVIPMEKPNNRALFKSSEWSYESDSESSSSWRRSTYIVRTCNCQCKNPCTRTMPLWKAGQSCSQAILSRHICLLRNASGTTTIDIVPLRFGTRQARHSFNADGDSDWCDEEAWVTERHDDCSAFHRPYRFQATFTDFWELRLFRREFFKKIGRCNIRPIPTEEFNLTLLVVSSKYTSSIRVKHKNKGDFLTLE